MLEMYRGMVNSPETTIINDISESDTLIYVLDETSVPEELPNLMTLGTGTSAETVKVLEVNGNALTVERGFQGVARSWNSGTVIARNFTEYDYNALMENIKTLKTKTDTNADDILDLMSYIGDLENLDTTEKANLVLALNETYQELAAHKAEMASKHITESGTNANGSYIKFDDGTMIVYREFDGELGSTEIPSMLVPLPAPFLNITQARKAVGSVNGAFILEGDAMQNYGALSEYMVLAQSNTTWRISAKTVAPVDSTRHMRIGAMLIGRWK